MCSKPLISAEWSQPLPPIDAQQVFSTCAALGGSGWDHSALIKGLEHMSNFSIRKK